MNIELEVGQNVLFYPKSGDPQTSYMGRIVELEDDEVMIYVPQEKQVFESEKIVTTYTDEDTEEAVKDLTGTSKVASEEKSEEKEPEYEGVPENQAEMNWRLMEKLENSKDQHIEDLKERLEEVKELQKKKEGRHRKRKGRRRRAGRRRRFRESRTERDRNTSETEEVRLDVTLPQEEPQQVKNGEVEEVEETTESEETSGVEVGDEVLDDIVEKLKKEKEKRKTENIEELGEEKTDSKESDLEDFFEEVEERTKSLTQNQRGLITYLARNPESKTKEIFEDEELYASQEANSHALGDLEDLGILDSDKGRKNRNLWKLSDWVKEEVEKYGIDASLETEEKKTKKSPEPAVENGVFRPQYADVAPTGLIDPEKIPEDVESVECPICNDDYTKAGIAGHITKHDLNLDLLHKELEGEIKCIICGETFDETDVLSTHQRNQHNKVSTFVTLARYAARKSEELGVESIEETEEGETEETESGEGISRDVLNGDNPLENQKLDTGRIEFSELKLKLKEFLDKANYGLTVNQILRVSRKNVHDTSDSKSNRVYRALNQMSEVQRFHEKVDGNRKYFYHTGEKKPPLIESSEEKEEQAEPEVEETEEEVQDEYIPHRSHLGKELDVEGTNPLQGLDIEAASFDKVKLKAAQFTDKANRMASIKEMLEYSNINFTDSQGPVYNKLLRACTDNPDIQKYDKLKTNYYYSNFTASEDPETNAAKRAVLNEISQREYEIRRAILGQRVPEEVGETTTVSLMDLSEEYGSKEEHDYRDVFEMFCSNGAFLRAVQKDLDIEIETKREKTSQSRDPLRTYDLIIKRTG
jgi:Fe2+ or Zn2+ uptake regulation protein